MVPTVSTCMEKSPTSRTCSLALRTQDFDNYNSLRNEEEFKYRELFMHVRWNAGYPSTCTDSYTTYPGKKKREMTLLLFVFVLFVYVYISASYPMMAFGKYLPAAMSGNSFTKKHRLFPSDYCLLAIILLPSLPGAAVSASWLAFAILVWAC